MARKKSEQHMLIGRPRSGAPAAAQSTQPVPSAGWVLNVRLLIISVVLLIVGGGILYGWRTWQVSRNASTLLTQAELAEKEGDLKQAANWYHQYLKFRPGDVDVIVRRALAYDSTVEGTSGARRSLDLLRTAVGNAPDRDDVRRRLTERLFELREFDETIFHADKLLAETPADADILTLRAKALYGLAVTVGRPAFSVVAEALQKAELAGSKDVELYTITADVYRNRLTEMPEAERHSKADALMTQLGIMLQDDPRAQMALYLYRLRYGLAGPEEFLNRALKLAPEDLNVLLPAALRATDQGDYDTALTRLRTALRVAPDDPRTYRLMAEVFSRQGKPLQATEALAEGLENAGDDLQLRLALTENYFDAGRLAEGKQSLDQLGTLIGRVGPYLDAASLAEANDRVRMLRARYWLETDRPLDALPILQGLAATTQRSGDVQSDTARQVQRLLLLADAYGQANQWDRALLTYGQILELNPNVFQAQIGEAESLRAVGELDQAIARYQKIVEQNPSVPSAVWVNLARTQFLEQTGRSGERQWDDVRETIARAKQVAETRTNEQAQEDRVELLLLEAQVLAQMGNMNSAVSTLEQAIEARPGSVRPTAVLLFEAWQRSDLADREMERMKRNMTEEGHDRVAIGLIEAELLARRGQTLEAEYKLEGLLGTLTEESQKQEVRWRLIALELNTGQLSEVRGRLTSLAESHPNDFRVWTALAELALRQGELGQVASYETQLRRVEGDSGSIWRFFRVMRLLAELEKARLEPSALANDRRFIEAATQAAQLDSLRPTWSWTMLAQGRVRELEGKTEEAVDYYGRAVAQGSNSAVIYDALLSALYRQNRMDEAAELLARAPESVVSSSRLSPMAPEVLLRAGKVEEAAQTARTNASLRPGDIESRIRLGQVLTLASERTSQLDESEKLRREAEQAFKQTTEVFPNDVRGWQGLVWFYARTNQNQLATATMQRLADESLEIDPSERALALARGYQLLGDHAAAEQQFQIAAEKSPDNLMVLERLVAFYLKTDPVKAVPALRQILKIDPDSAVARQSLATLLAFEGEDAQFREAVDLLESGEADRRLQALLYLRRGSEEETTKAIAILKELASAPNAPVADRLLLARAYEQAGNIPLAHGQYKKITEQGRPSPGVLAAHIDFLLRHERANEAWELAKRLRVMEPDDFRAIELQARAYRQLGRSDQEVADLIRVFSSERLDRLGPMGNRRDQAEILLATAGVYTQFGLLTQAEALYERLIAQGSLEDAAARYSVWLLDQGRYADAVSEATQRLNTEADVAAASHLAGLLTVMAGRQAERFPEAEARLEEMLGTHQNDVRLLVDLATLYHVQGQFEKAERLYRRLLEAIPNHVQALNNLALLISETEGDAAEAMKLIDSAVRLSGDSQSSLDSKAIVLLNSGKNDEAYMLMKQLMAESPRMPPGFRLHLAFAALKTGHTEEAVASFRRAEADGLTNQVLLPCEVKMIETLRQAASSAAADTPPPTNAP
jgi:tetratricopeptide (TPR) repeat protein